MNSPFPSDSALRNPFVSSFRTSTCAPPTKAPVGSLVIPTRVAVEVCAHKRHRVAQTKINRRYRCLIVVSIPGPGLIPGGRRRSACGCAGVTPLIDRYHRMIPRLVAPRPAIDELMGCGRADTLVVLTNPVVGQRRIRADVPV